MKTGLVVTLAGLFMFSVGCADVQTPSEPGDATDEGPETAQDENDLKAATVSIRLPVLGDDGKLLSRFNAQMKAAKLPPFPDTVEIRGGAKGARLKDGDKKWREVDALADKAGEVLKNDIFLKTLGEPSDYMTKDPATSICYTGNPKLVVALIENHTDSAFSDQLTIHGWRHRSQKVMADNIEPEGEATFPSIWRNWRGKGDAILTLSASSDGGEETNIGLIAKCR